MDALKTKRGCCRREAVILLGQCRNALALAIGLAGRAGESDECRCRQHAGAVQPAVAALKVVEVGRAAVGAVEHSSRAVLINEKKGISVLILPLQLERVGVLRSDTDALA